MAGSRAILSHGYMLSGLYLSSVWTWAMWAYPLSSGAGNYRQLVGAAASPLVSLFINDVSQLSMWSDVDGNWPGSGDHITFDAWNHCAVVRYGDTLPVGYEVFVNGVSAGTRASTTVSAVLQVTFGGRTTNTLQYLRGYMADCRMWTAALTPTQIKDVMRGGQMAGVTRQRYFPCGQGSPEVDISGRGGVGTLSGTTSLVAARPPMGSWGPQRSTMDELEVPDIVTPIPPLELKPMDIEDKLVATDIEDELAGVDIADWLRAT